MVLYYLVIILMYLIVTTLQAYYFALSYILIIKYLTTYIDYLFYCDIYNPTLTHNYIITLIMHSYIFIYIIITTHSYL